MPLIAITDLMDQQRQDKERQENSSSTVEPIGDTDKNHTSDTDSKTRKDDGPAPVFHSQLSEKLERLSATEQAADHLHSEHQVEDNITKHRTSTLDAPAQDSTGGDLMGTQLPHRPKSHSHTRENTAIEEPDVLLG
ncbi:hypothetical protein PVAR5_8245 [Paecilomyces variotii No. 5]|uniref:Uncharacterized protein n=1 Tax=Byssochlamys spectabilis (strain No. 5 / NBRC 109023) TaxID=1356009 RepID=V5I5R2_BYSSN|nr:hypothetical protein PVAR5_8245 [Paecilomyces variotii No. 5]